MKRNAHTPNEKAKMVLEALRGERTINEIASANEVHPTMLSRWKGEAESNLHTLFQDNAAKKEKGGKGSRGRDSGVIRKDWTVDHAE